MTADATGGAAALAQDGFAVSAAPLVRAPALAPARLAELVAPLSEVFDLAESQPPGHAARVAHVALTVAERLGLDAEVRRTVLYAGLLHDSGVAVRRLPDGSEPDGGHAGAGAWVAARLGLDERVQDAVRYSHERWDGRGRPGGLAGKEVPVPVLVVSAAHWAVEAADAAPNPLMARAQLRQADVLAVAPISGIEATGALQAVLGDDATWMALWSADLPAMLADRVPGEGRATAKRVERVAAAMGDVVDAAAREPGRAARVAALAAELARRSSVPAGQCRAIAVAGYLLDVGQLGVPRDITDKPAILTVDEMEMMRRHPGWGTRIIELLPGMSEIALWVEAHHERCDGRGYPEMLTRDEIPFAARVLAIADTYCALRAWRPDRPALGKSEALKVIRRGTGGQFDAALVKLLPDAVASVDAPETRRRAPRATLR